MSFALLNRRALALCIILAVTLAGCVSWITFGEGQLRGHVVVIWNRQDRFIYVPDKNDLLRFKPSFMNYEIVPGPMYTDGGSVPRVLWGIPGLSPWALGPAYIIHDWIFAVHRCKWPADPELAAITFEDSAKILGEVGKALVLANLIDDNKLDEIAWAVRTRYAQDIWDSPPTEKECEHPPKIDIHTFKAAGQAKVVDFRIPPPRRDLHPRLSQ